MLETSAFESLYGGQFTSTQLIKPNYLVILPTDAAPQFLYKLTPLFISWLLVLLIAIFVSVSQIPVLPLQFVPEWKSKMVKIYTNLTGYPNLFHGCNFCFILMNLWWVWEGHVIGCESPMQKFAHIMVGGFVNLGKNKEKIKNSQLVTTAMM